MKWYYFKYKITISSVNYKVKHQKYGLKWLELHNFEKSIMVLNKERDMCFKCKYFHQKSENEGMDFKCKKWKTS